MSFAGRYTVLNLKNCLICAYPETTPHGVCGMRRVFPRHYRFLPRLYSIIIAPYHILSRFYRRAELFLTSFARLVMNLSATITPFTRTYAAFSRIFVRPGNRGADIGHKMRGDKFLPPRRFKISDLVKRKVIPQVHPAEVVPPPPLFCREQTFLRMLLRLKQTEKCFKAAI